MNNETDRPRIDWINAVLAVATSAAIGWVVWNHLGHTPPRNPPKVGTSPPPLRLLDVQTSEPLLLVGLRGKIVWIMFWSATAPADRAVIEDLASVTKQLQGRSRFSVVVVAVDRDSADAVKAASKALKGSLPVYIASEETQRAYGVTARQLPVHFLIDDDGQIGVIARGSDHATLARLADQAETWLDSLEPLGRTRFASLNDGLLNILFPHKLKSLAPSRSVGRALRARGAISGP